MNQQRQTKKDCFGGLESQKPMTALTYKVRQGKANPAGFGGSGSKETRVKSPAQEKEKSFS